MCLINSLTSCVQLTDKNRAKLTDFGTCAQKVLVEEDFVGTPIYMPPEKDYDTQGDIYAFGILFWFICSNNVSLPKNYQSQTSHHGLLEAVQGGLRPERLDKFDDVSWNLMNCCWHGNPKRRPHLGDILAAINLIKQNIKQ